MPLRPQGTALQQGSLGSHAPRVHVLPRGDIIKSVGDNPQSLKELVRKDVVRRFVYLVQPSDNVSFQLLVHLYGSRRCCRGLGLAQVLLPEQELAVQIAQLDYIWVSQHYGSSFGARGCVLLGAPYSEHGIVLEQLAANSSSTDHEEARAGQLLDGSLAHDYSEAIRPIPSLSRSSKLLHVGLCKHTLKRLLSGLTRHLLNTRWLALSAGQARNVLAHPKLGQHFHCIVIEELMNGRELVGYRLDALLSDQAAHEGTKRVEDALTLEGK